MVVEGDEGGGCGGEIGRMWWRRGCFLMVVEGTCGGRVEGGEGGGSGDGLKKKKKLEMVVVLGGVDGEG